MKNAPLGLTKCLPLLFELLQCGHWYEGKITVSIPTNVSRSIVAQALHLHTFAFLRTHCVDLFGRRREASLRIYPRAAPQKKQHGPGASAAQKEEYATSRIPTSLFSNCEVGQIEIILQCSGLFKNILCHSVNT